MRNAILILTLLLAGCSTRADEQEMSTIYDKVGCAQLSAQRSALLAQYPARPPEQGERAPMGVLGGLDLRSQTKKDTAIAYGKIDAMERSMQRRKCRG